MKDSALKEHAPKKSAPSTVRSFAPIANPEARVLILGSMPGVASLQAGEYYAHPRNAFWRILGDIAGASPERPYSERLQKLREHGLAVWDVLQSCDRPGSLDADIVPDSMLANDFSGFLASHRRLRRIVFNGAAAEQCFRRHALPGLIASGVISEQDAQLTLLRLPSTSPAHAGMPYERKLALWREALAI